MKSVKWLFALFFALTFTLLDELIGAFAVKAGLEWYNTLLLPAFSLPSTVHTVIWCIVYVAEAYVIAQLLVSNYIKPFMATYLAIKLLSAVWTVTFFGAHGTLPSLIVLTTIILINFYYLKRLLHIPTHRLKSLLFIPVLCWYCYLWILNYCIALTN